MLEKFNKATGKVDFEYERADYVRLTPPPHYDDVMDLSKATAADLQSQLDAAVAMLVEITGQSREMVNVAIAKRLRK